MDCKDREQAYSCCGHEVGVSSVSVVVPTYNRADLLKLTLQSIIRQTHPPLEISVVDDGSTDHTPSVCAEFGEAVRYFQQANQGLPTARNNGIRAARGEWIALCDSDDLWCPEKLEWQLGALAASRAQWSVTDFSFIGTDGSPAANGRLGFGHGFPVFEETRATPDEHFGRWLARRQIEVGSQRIKIYTGDAFGMLFEGNIALPSTAVMARNFLEASGLFNPAFRAEETEFFHRLAAAGKVVIVMSPLTLYRVGHPSLIKGDPTPFIVDAISSIELARALRPRLSRDERAAFHRGRRRLRRRLAYTRLSATDGAGARQALRGAWRDGPFPSPRAIAVFVASLLPAVALQGLHHMKRMMRWTR